MRADRSSRTWLGVAKVAFVAVAIVVSAVVLWTQQSDDALLRASSFPAALVEVAFWAFPGLVLYLVVARRPIAVAVEGLLIVGLLVAQWFASATDRHSTASLGPFLLGWALIPGIVIGGCLPALYQEWRHADPARPQLYLLIPGTVVLAFLGPLGWIAAAVLWWLTLRRARSGKNQSTPD